MQPFEKNARCPLDGVRIVDLSRVVAGNMVSLALADFGAEEIKVETPEGDALRDWVVELPDDEMGAVPMHCVVPRLSRTPGAIRLPAPRLGEHNDEVLVALGLSAAEIVRLKAADIVSTGKKRKGATAS